MAEEKSIERKSCCELFLEKDGLPVIRDVFIKDIRKVPLERWERMGLTLNPAEPIVGGSKQGGTYG